MTDGQASAWLIQNGATYVKSQGHIQWWRLPSGTWISKASLGNGHFELRQHQSCGCNG